MTCPSCGLESRPSALYCGCGYGFAEGSWPQGLGTGSRVPGPFRPTWINLGTTLVGAVILGLGGLFVQFGSSCWSGTQDCAAYSWIGNAVADALSWPIFMIQKIAVGGTGFVPSYDPVIREFWWLIVPILWTYYYLVLGVVKLAISSIRSSLHRR